MLVDELADPVYGRLVALGDPVHLEAGVPRGRCPVRPDPEEVTASAGTSSGRTGWPGTELSFTTAALASFTHSTSSGLSASGWWPRTG
ncbi:hypothetical protein STENM327S_06491 [Streptomyces tendae]